MRKDRVKYTYTISRVKVTSNYDPTKLLGYNYYVKISEFGGNAEVVRSKRELLYTTLSSENPLDVQSHDLTANTLLQKRFLNPQPSSPGTSISGDRSLSAVVRY